MRATVTRLEKGVLANPMALRALILCTACFCGMWSGICFLTFRSEAAIDQIGSAIERGEPFKTSLLIDVNAHLDDLENQSAPAPTLRHSIALVELRLADLELEARHPAKNNPRFEKATLAIINALRQVPSDSFLWFALFWLSKTQYGTNEVNLSYLKLSYLTGPHEGWVAARRNRVAAPLLSIVPKDLADLIIAEFDDLVKSGFIDIGAEILTGPGWGNRDLLLASLENVPLENRRQLSNAIYNLGFDATVPGVFANPLRPWR